MGSILAIVFLAGCANTGLSSQGGPFAPSGIAVGQESVDGLIVGHRLMAAGEFELALKSYLRSAVDHGLNVDVLSAIGSANLKLGRLGQAETILRRATREDKSFVPAWNNLGVVLMERGETGEAARVFKVAFALDNGNSTEIRENLRLALARIENISYDDANDYNFALVRRGAGDFLLMSNP